MLTKYHPKYDHVLRLAKDRFIKEDTVIELRDKVKNRRKVQLGLVK